MDFRSSPPHNAAMIAILFDTLRLSRTLRDKGHFTAEQAETLAEALGEASQGDLVTKADFAELRTEIAEIKAELKGEIAAVRTELKAEIAAVKTELLKWTIGAIGVQTVVILGALMSMMKILAK